MGHVRGDALRSRGTGNRQQQALKPGGPGDLSSLNCRCNAAETPSATLQSQDFTSREGIGNRPAGRLNRPAAQYPASGGSALSLNRHRSDFRSPLFADGAKLPVCFSGGSQVITDRGDDAADRQCSQAAEHGKLIVSEEFGQVHAVIQRVTTKTWFQERL